MAGRKVFIGFILALLLVWAVWSTYSWHQCRKEKREMLVSVYLEEYNAFLTLGDMGGLLEYQLQNNASERIISFYVWNFRDNAWSVENAFWILYAYSGEEKFWKIRTAVMDLRDFLNTVLNRPPEERIGKIQENMETLKKFGTLFKELSKYRDPFEIPDKLAEELLQTSRELKW
ncbi:hypothetical protein PNA2_1102 [Pyrococcus sp. NA2]|uniref:hypothetical protein n=1 Tax=Pyrococcus sp. (strain NA2) TaxID=342949 RepID=UPI000209AAF0|nr:hypothetical protein [Pyrococcus sp. NA2]AEC52018.1 hypothetical protein PNA2_1102 [Pyrococcus sp. NA2]